MSIICKNCLTDIPNPKNLTCNNGEKCIAYYKKIYSAKEPCCVCIDSYITNDTPGYVNACGHWLCIDCYLLLGNSVTKHPDHDVSPICPMCSSKLLKTGMHIINGTQIFIKLYAGKTITVIVDAKSTPVYVIKDLIKFKIKDSDHLEGFDTKIFKLLYCGKILQNHLTLSDYNVNEGSTLFSMLCS